MTPRSHFYSSDEKITRGEKALLLLLLSSSGTVVGVVVVREAERESPSVSFEDITAGERHAKEKSLLVSMLRNEVVVAKLFLLRLNVVVEDMFLSLFLFYLFFMCGMFVPHTVYLMLLICIDIFMAFFFFVRTKSGGFNWLWGWVERYRREWVIKTVSA